MSNINLGPQDAFLQLATVAVPPNGQNNLSGVLDLEAVGPFSDAKHLGLIAVTVPAMPELVSGTLTLQIQVAEASLTHLAEDSQDGDLKTHALPTRELIDASTDAPEGPPCKAET